MAAGLSSPQGHALSSLLALNGLRISEALGTNIEDLGSNVGIARWWCTARGGKRVTIPLAPGTARAVDLAIGERLEGAIFLDASAAASTATPRPGWFRASPSEPGYQADRPPQPAALFHHGGA